MKKKSLVVNSIYSVIYKLLNVLFPLITVTYASRIILADGVGRVAEAQNFVQYFVLVASLGIPNYGIREIAKVRENKKDVNKVFSELFAINTISTTICFIVYLVVVLSNDYFNSSRMLNLSVGLLLLLNYANVDWFYQGFEEYSYIAKRNFVVKLASVVFVFLFVRERNDYIFYALIQCFALGGNYLFNVFNLRKKVSLSFQNINIIEHLKPILILLASTISIELYTLLDTTMLGVMCSDETVGFYSNSTKLARIINTIISSMALVLLPRLSYYYHNKMMDELNQVVNRVLRLLLLISIPAAIGVAIFADYIIIVLFGDSFAGAITTLRILSVLIMAVALNNFFGTQVLITIGKEKSLFKSVLLGAIVNLILNIFLIRLYKHNGAAIASVVSEIFVLVATWMYARKEVNIKVECKYFVKIAIQIMVMIVVVSLVKFVISNMVISLGIGIILGAFAYGITGYIVKNDTIVDVINIICKWIGNHAKRR